MKITRVYALISIAMLLMVMSAGMLIGKAQSASIVVSPDTIFQKGETETVRGYNFPPNTTARVDLILPDASVVEGIITAEVNMNGSFSAIFICPDKNGDGYVRVVDNSVILSTLVTFEGTQTTAGELEVSLNPNLILEGQTSHITVLAEFLETANYVVDFLAVNPAGQDEVSYYVLHRGKLEFDYKFSIEGYYWINISVEDTPYTYTQYVNVQDNPNNIGDDDDNNPTTNYTVSFEITNYGKDYEIMLWKEGVGYITSGNISVRSPDGKTTNVIIQNGVASFTVSKMGTYVAKYVSQGKQFSTSFEYKVTISFTSSSFDNDAVSKLVLLVDGVKPEGEMEVNVTGAVEDTMTLVDGDGEYTATVVGEYDFELSYLDVSKYTKEIYEDTYSIETLEAVVEGETIIVTGMVIGEKTQTGGADIRVQISVTSQDNFKTTVTSDTDGSFIAFVDVVNKGGIPSGIDVQVKANIQEIGQSSAYKTASVHLSHDIWAEWGWLIILAVILIILLLWYKGMFYKWSGGRFLHPPKSVMNKSAKARQQVDW